MVSHGKDFGEDRLAADISGSAESGVSRKAGEETILVVKNSADIRRIVTKHLRRRGYRVQEVETAAAALEILESAAPVDLVLSDVYLAGGRSGADLVTEIRARWPATKFLLTSGFTEEYLRNANSLPDGVTLLSKPYRMHELFRRLRDALDAPGTT
jgi:CheY-like chemotaxis protein